MPRDTLIKSCPVSFNNGRVLQCEIVDDNESRHIGLQKYDSIPDTYGMLFKFDKPQKTSFIMASVKFPIDIIFLDRDGYVSRVVESAKPGSNDTWTVPSVLDVIETKAGFCKENGIRVGSRVSVNPRFAARCIIAQEKFDPSQDRADQYIRRPLLVPDSEPREDRFRDRDLIDKQLQNQSIDPEHHEMQFGYDPAYYHDKGDSITTRQSSKEEDMNDNPFSRKNRLVRRGSRKQLFEHVAQSMNTKKLGKITTQNAGMKAVELVRSLFNNINVPSSPDLGYTGIRQAMTSDGTVDSGVITVHAELRTVSNSNVGIDIPIEIRNGEMIEPSVFVYNGLPKIMAQSAFDELVKDNTIFDTYNTRGMFTPPNNFKDQRIKIEKVNSGMFTANRQLLASALSGINIDDSDYTLSLVDHFSRTAGLFKVYDSNAILQQINLCESQLDNPRVQETVKKMWEKVKNIRGDKMRQLDQTDQAIIAKVGDLVDKMTRYQTEKEQNDVLGKLVDQSTAADPIEDQTKWSLDAAKKNKDNKQNPYIDRPDHDHNSKDSDHLDPAERDEGLSSGKVTHLTETMEIRNRGGVVFEKPSGTKCTVVRDAQGDNRVYHVKFDDGMEAMVEAHYLKGASKMPVVRMPGAKPDFKRLCTKCNQAPCKCPDKRKKKDEPKKPSQQSKKPPQVKSSPSPSGGKTRKISATDIIAKIESEIDEMASQKFKKADVDSAILSKYGPKVYEEVKGKINAMFEKPEGGNDFKR